MIRLFTSLYEEPDQRRRNELGECLRRNLDNPHIDSVHLFLEKTEQTPIQGDALITRTIARRPTYLDFMLWIQDVEPTKSDVSLICNSDIYFDSSISVLADVMRPGQCAALSRWDVAGSGKPVLFNRNDSQDAWVFKAPLRRVQADFPVGIPRCDNRFLYELQQAGYEVANPAFSIRAYHLHAGVRGEYKNENLSQFVDPPYAYLWPHNLWSLPRTLWHNLCHTRARVSWRLDRRRIARSLPLRVARKLLVWLRPANKAPH